MQGYNGGNQIAGTSSITSYNHNSFALNAIVDGVDLAFIIGTGFALAVARKDAPRLKMERARRLLQPLN